MLISLHCATHTYKHEHVRAMEISALTTRIHFKYQCEQALATPPCSYSSLWLPPCTPIKVLSHPVGPNVRTKATSFAWRILLGKVLGAGIGDGRGRKRRRRGIMRRRTLESVLLHTQHRGRRRRGGKGTRVGLLLRPTAHPLYKPKTNSRRFQLLGSWLLAHILNLFSTTLHINSANIVCCSN